MMWNRREITKVGASTLALSALGGAAHASSHKETVTADLRRDVGPLEHIWSHCGGSDRAEITLREQWRLDAKRMRNETGLKRVRFHDVLGDDMGVSTKSYQSTPKPPNFQKIDAVYDGLLDLGLQPFVELSFMPGRLASGTKTFGLYKGNITHPQSLPEWEAFIRLFVQHLIDRYGSSEVQQWYFEVWNEPNLTFFWDGTAEQYFEFYRTTAAAVKAIDPALKIGGPSTALLEWVPEFLDYCARTGSPVDFVSTHIYAGDDQKKIFGKSGRYRQNDVIPAGMAQVRAQIDSSTFKGTALWLTEWSSDSPAMIGHVISRCLQNCQAMSHWEISGSYEEIAIPSWIVNEGDNGYGLFAPRNIPKPSFNTYKLMNRLGNRRLHAEGPALASRSEAGGSAIMVWNLAEVQQTSGIPGMSRTRKVVGDAKKISVTLRGAQPEQSVRVSYVDQERGSPLPAWRALGSPQYITASQLTEIRAAAELGHPEVRKLSTHCELTLELPPEGIALLELD